MKERNRRNVPPVLRTGGILLPKKRTGAGAPRERLPLLIKGSCPSAHTGAEGIRTSIFPGIVNNRAFTIPQSQPSVRRLCQLPLHKGAVGAPAPVRFSRVLGHLKGVVTRGNPPVIPGTDSELVGADALIGPMGSMLKLEWVDVLNRPTQILTEVF